MTPRSPSPAPRRAATPTARRHGGRRNTHRLAMLGALAAVSFVAGLVVGWRHEPSGQRLGREWGRAWERGDPGAMHALLTPAARRAWPPLRFARAYRRAATTATLAALSADRPRVRGETATISVRARTRLFGTVRGDLTLPLRDGSDGPRVAWRPDLVFPGLRRGERLTRRMRMPPR